MKKALLLKFTTRFVFALALICVSYYSFTNGTGAPAGNTGAPGDATCAQSGCHAGTLITSGTNWNNFTITTNIPANGYVPGSSYTITISHTVAGINKWGFEFVALNSSTFAQAGSLAIGTGMQSLSSGGKTYLTHNSSGTSGSGSKTWSFTWTAPNPGVGSVSFYATVNAANGDGTNSGDQIYAKSISVSEFTNLPTAVIDGLPSNGNVCLGDTLNLLGSGINSPTTYAWTFSGINNPTLQAQQNPRVLFTSIGQKTITLKTTNAFGSSSTTTVFVNVINKPTATISPSGSLPICGNDSVTLNANFNALFTYVWSPGNETTPSIKTVTPGVYKVKVTNTTTGCSATSSNVTLSAQPKPVAILTVSKDSICSADSLTLTSNTPFTTYQFFDNNTLVSSGSSSSFTAKFPSGSRKIGLVVTGSGCSSDTVWKTVFVQPLLPAPSLTCGTKTTSSVSFNWNAVAGASGYEVSTDTGKTWLSNNGVLSYTINGLAPNTNAQLWVRAIDAALCSRGNTGTLICTNGACTPITYKLQFAQTACLQSNTDSALIPITVSGINVANVGIQYGNTPYTKSLTYSARVVLGTNDLSLKIVDSLNVGCPRVDTTIRLSGINPIGKKPVVGVQGALCSSDSSLHTFVLFNTNSGADYFTLFRNSDSVPFKIIPAVNGDTIIAGLLRKLSPVQNGDMVYAIAIDTATRCSKPSLPYSATVFQSPKAGFTSAATALTVTFTDTTARSAKRNWLFSGAIPDEVNSTVSITKTFPSSGTKAIKMEVTDSNGCMEHATSLITLFNVGLSESKTTQPLSVHPNPAGATIYFTLDQTEEALVSVYDVHGKLVKQEVNNDVERKIEVQMLTPGLYFISISQGDTIYFTKFMKE